MQLGDNWWLKYLGKPWEATPRPPYSYNCGELVRAIHLDLCGIDAPPIPVTDAQSRLQCLKAMRPEIFDLLPLPPEMSPRNLDVAFLGRRSLMAHCGIGVETCEGLRVLHCPEAACGVVLDGVHELALAGFPIIRWFRHRELWDAQN